MSLKQQLLEKMHMLEVSPKRSLGQNFLISEHVITKIVNQALSYGLSQMVEIGPGLGALTDSLSAVHPNLTVIEMDKSFSEYWRSKGVQVIEGDALKIDWSALVTKDCVVVSNLPYQIGASIVIERSVEPQKVKAMVLMFQKEVAQRILAEHGNKVYGLLTVIAQTFWGIKKLVDAGPGDFYPTPNVASRVAVFERKSVNLNSPQKYISFVRAAFAQRRKLLIKNLKAICDEEKILKAFKKLNLDEKVRAESVSVVEFIELYKELFE